MRLLPLLHLPITPSRLPIPLRHSMDKLAIIDIGSNSIRYMSARVGDSHVAFSHKLLCTTRLGEGLLKTGRLQEQNMLASYQAILHFKQLAKEENLPVFAYATSAVRDAENRNEFLTLLSPLKIDVNILSGADEGRFAFKAIVDTSKALIDIGGASSQLVTQQHSKSFPVGCVRAKDYCAMDDFFKARDALFSWFSSVYSLDYTLPAEAFGVGGTITTLGALLMKQREFDSVALNSFSFTLPMLEELLYQLFEMGDARKQHPLLKRRHDVIIYGGLILSYIMERFSISLIRPSSSDGMEGYALHLLDVN